MKEQFTVRGNFAAESPITFDWLKQAIETLLAKGHDGYRNFSCAIRVAPDVERTLESPEATSWLKAIEPEWGQVKSCTIWQEGIFAQINVLEARVSLDVKRSSMEDANGVILDLMKSLQLSPTPTSRQGKHNITVERRFQIAELVSPEFLRNLVDQFVQLVGAKNSFSGYLRIGRGIATRVQYNDTEVWLAAAEKDWTQVVESTANWAGHRFELDHLRGLAWLQVQAGSKDECDTTLARLAEILHLRFLKSNPFQYRKAAATYQIRNWNLQELANALDELVSKVSPDGNPSIREAYVTSEFDDKVERLHGFFDASSLIRFIRETKSELRRLGFSIEGVNGVAVGIVIDAIDRTLQFRTSKPPEELASVVEPLRSRLKLKLTEGRETGSSATASAVPSPAGDKGSTRSIIAVLGAALGAGALVTAGFTIYRAYATDYELHVTSPALKDGKFNTNAGQLELSWYLQPKDPVFNVWDYHSSAEIIINGTKASTPEIVTSPYKLSLERGQYVVEIRPIKKAAPMQFTVIIGAAK